ncbi:MAG: UDP-N-acetylmuramoyl-L-alanine--D-glutamate ligase [Vicingaceae bacterium]
MTKKERSIAVLGAGESGVGAALLALKVGDSVFVSDAGQVKAKYSSRLDQAGIEWESGVHSEERILQVDLIVKSPGIPSGAEIVKKALDKNIEIISEIEYAFRHCNGKVIAITGSNGKTTTTNLIYHLLKKAGKNACMAGNMGRSFAAEVANGENDYYVLEVSSFQLDDIVEFKPFISILLNITPDHLDRYHQSLREYADAKFNIIRNQGDEDYFIYNLDDEVILEGLKSRSIAAHQVPFTIKKKVETGAYLQGDSFQVHLNKQPLTMSVHDLALQGKHNIYNSMAASITGRILELRKDLIRESLSDFQNIEHRLEYVMKVHGINFINDSKATNVNATWYALESLDKDIIWIVGGVDKGNDYSMLNELVAEKVKAIVCLGKDNKKLIKAFKDIVPNITEVDTAKEAVRIAYAAGTKNDTVILSPACASFDLFENYEDRGHQFKQAVKSL